jgi:hypothetical protein
MTGGLAADLDPNACTAAFAGSCISAKIPAAGRCTPCRRFFDFRSQDFFQPMQRKETAKPVVEGGDGIFGAQGFQQKLIEN